MSKDDGYTACTHCGKSAKGGERIRHSFGCTSLLVREDTPMLRDDIAQIIFGEDNDQIAWDASGDIRQHYLNDAARIIARFKALVEEVRAENPFCDGSRPTNEKGVGGRTWDEACDTILKAIEEGK